MRKGKVNRIICGNREEEDYFSGFCLWQSESVENCPMWYILRFFLHLPRLSWRTVNPNWFIRAFVIYSSLKMLARLPSIPAFEIKLEIRGEKMRRNEEGVFKLFFQFSNSRGGWKLSLFPQMREYDEMEMNSMDFFPALKIRGNQLLIFLHLTVPMPGGEKYAR